MKEGRTSHAAPYELLTRHSLFWLVFTTVTGLLLSVLLLIPSLGETLQPFTYGRWTTVHLNASLYGWSAIPLLALLFLQYLPASRPVRTAGWAVGAWSAMLLFAAAGWLGGRTGGKLFMEWTGASRFLLIPGMGMLAVVLWIGYLSGRLREDRSGTDSVVAGWSLATVKFAVLAVLTAVPFVMAAAAEPSLYPPINPDSGGATGGSLLGSTLGLVMIYWITPFALRLPASRPFRAFIPVLSLLILHTGAFALLDHGDHSHHEGVELAAMLSLVPWVPIMIRHMRSFDWPEESRRWLFAYAAWGSMLVFDGLFTFMPGVLERWKFTNALVGHVHIAMAGMITSFNVLVLVVINREGPLRRIFSKWTGFGCWHTGTVIHAAALIAAGTIEARHPDWLFTGHREMAWWYGIRLGAGLMMAWAAFSWLLHAHAEEGIR